MKFAYILFITLFVSCMLAVAGTVITAIPFFQNRAQSSDWFGLSVCILAAFACAIGGWAAHRAP